MHKKTAFALILACILGLFLTNCTKDVVIPFPDTPSEIVVDGQIETGSIPLVFLTRTQSFNDPLDPSSLQGLFVNDAIVNVSNGTDTVQLTELCAGSLTPAELEFATQLLGISAEDLEAINYCIYIDASATMIGEIGGEYELMIETLDGERLNAVTTINEPLEIDSLWFEYFGSSDSLGFIHGEMTDPVGVRNAYQWSAQRINFYPGTSDQKDFGFIAPIGSVFEDRFFDGLTFEFFYNRGQLVNSPKEDDNNEESGFFKEGDTVRVKFSTISLETHDYIFISDDQLTTNGSPFAVPTNLEGNVEGGRGLWAGYAPLLDTIVCVP